MNYLPDPTRRPMAVPLGALIGLLWLTGCATRVALPVPAIPAIAIANPPAPTAASVVSQAGGQLAASTVRGLALVPSGVISSNGAAMADPGEATAIKPSDMMAAKAKFGLLATGQRPLAAFKVEVVDAALEPVLGPFGRPLFATTDGTGGFAIADVPDDRNVLLRITLPGEACTMWAYLPKHAHGDGTVKADLEGVGTHVLAYMLANYVQGKQDVLDRLTGEAEARARGLAEAALTAVAGGRIAATSMATSDLVDTVGVWRGLSADFDAQIRTIEATLKPPTPAVPATKP